MLRKKSEKGQALILIVLAIVGMLGLTALAVDGGYAYADRRQAQNAADAAALDAGLAKARGGNDAAVKTSALSLIAANGYGSNSVFVSVNSPPVNFIDSDNDGGNECEGVNDNDGYDGGDDEHNDGGDNDDDNDGVENSDDDDDDNDGVDDEHDDDDDNDGVDDEHDNHDNDDDNDGEENDHDDDDDNDGVDDEHDGDDDNDGVDDEHDEDNDNDHDNDGIDDEHDNDDDNDGEDDDDDGDDDNDGNEEPSAEQCQHELYNNDPAYVQVIITSYVDTYFASIVGINRTTNVVQAIVRVKPAVVGQMYNGNAIVALKPSGCDAINFYGEADAEIYGGGVFSNSTDTCGLRFNGNPKIKVHDGKVFSAVASGFTYTGHPEIVPYPPQTNVGAFTYPPPEGFLPNIVCSGNATKTGNVMSPGNWTGTFPPNGVSTFQPGVYCINGDFRLNGGDNVQGTDVVFVMNSGDVQWNGGADIKFDAPNDGPFKGLLLYVPMSNAAELHLNGSSDSDLSGTILAPASHIDFNGSGDIQSANTQIIGYTVEMGGSSDSHIYYTDSGNYDVTEPPVLELVQ